ncbi:unnamed protein product, partial [Staurois parvus]
MKILYRMPSLVLRSLARPPRLQKQMVVWVQICTQERRYKSTEARPRAKNWEKGVIAAGALIGLGGFLIYEAQQRKVAQADSEEHPVVDYAFPTYTREDVKKHKALADRVWVTYAGEVFDITDFVELHPGGDRILLAAGGALEPFWALYGVHKSEHVLEILQEYKVGVLGSDDKEEVQDLSDPYSQDPSRHPVLKINSAKPFNAEPPPEFLTENYITPNELFFKRNHLPVPDINPDEYQLTVE